MDGKIKNIPEILAPAGSFECLKAAVNAGCDAVYAGGSIFGARAYANNFDKDKMLEAIDYCHLHNVKIYLTVNTLLGGREIREKLFDFLLPFYEAGIDAVIVQDMGVMKKIKEWFLDIPIHASTQMSVMSGEVGDWLSDFGVTRIVPARELSIGELRQMRQKTKLEIEVFVHGALCYSYSGQCLFSSFQGGRSGNRGMCAAPCRMPYHLNGVGNQADRYIFSTKELCNLPLLGQMIDAGIDSFKIEGRMKKPEYVAFVTSIYKKYRDLHLKYGKGYEKDYLISHMEEWNEDLRCLAEIYNRNGFTCGYLNGKCGLSGRKASVAHTDTGNMKLLLNNEKDGCTMSEQLNSGMNDCITSEQLHGGMDGCIMPEPLNSYMDGCIMPEPYRGRLDVEAAGNSGMLSALRPKHGGVRVGEVIKKDKYTVSYKLVRDIYTHDVVEFRDKWQKPSYEYTIGKSGDDSGIYKKAGGIVTAKYKKGSRINVSDGVYRTRDASLIEMVRDKYIGSDKKIHITGVFSASEGEKASLTVIYQNGKGVFKGLSGQENISEDDINIGSEVTAYGDVCERAKSHPSSYAQIEKCISQTGDSDFVLDKLDISIKGELFLPVGGLKKLRRYALEMLRQKMLAPYHRDVCKIQNIYSNETDAVARDKKESMGVDGLSDNKMHQIAKKGFCKVVVSVVNTGQADAVLDCETVSSLYLHMDTFSEEELLIYLNKCHDRGKKAYLILPRILRGFALEMESLEWDGFVVRNMESFLFLADKCNVPKQKIVTDSNLYIMNKYAYEFWRGQGVREFMLPFELVAGKIAGEELSDMAGLDGAYVTVYTHIPLMVSAQCTLYNTSGCRYSTENKVSKQTLEDSKGREFFVVNSCKYCYNTVYQGEAADYTMRVNEFVKIGASAVRLDFYFEKPEKIRKILERLGADYGQKESG